MSIKRQFSHSGGWRDVVKTQLKQVSPPLSSSELKSYPQHHDYPKSYHRSHLPFLSFGSWASIQNGASSSWALSREPLKFRLNFRNGSPGTSTRGEEFVTKVVKGNQFWHNARTAHCSNCTNPAVLCAHVLLHSVILPKRFFPQWEQCWVFDIKSGYCKAQNSLTKKSLKDCMEKCYIPEPGGCSISSEAFRRQISRLKYWTARRSRVKQDIGRFAMGQYSFWAILSW